MKNCFPLYDPDYETIQKIRKKMGWTTEELSNHLHINQLDLIDYEENIQKMPLPVFHLLIILVIHELSKDENINPTPEEIKNFRLGLEMTQLEFSKIAHVSKRRVSAWEAGEHQIKAPAWTSIQLHAAIKHPGVFVF